MEIHGKLVDIHNQTIFPATVTIEKGQIAHIRRNSHRGNFFILPGFVDAHIHIETSLLLPSEFARIAVRHGTISAVCNLDPLSDLLGANSIRLIRENGAKVPFKFHFQTPTAASYPTLSEARARRVDGEQILIHERNFTTLFPLLQEDSTSCSFGSEHLNPDHFLLGHINLLAKKGIERGMDPVDTIRAATYSDRLDVGLLREGDPADFILVENLENLRVIETYIDGNLVFRGEPLFQSVLLNLPSPITYLPETPTILSLPEGEALTYEVQNGKIVPTTSMAPPLTDLTSAPLKLVEIPLREDRKPSLHFIRGFGLRRGAIALSTPRHILAVGTTDRDLATAINAIVTARGGLTLSNQGKVDLLPLPIGGLFSPLSGKELAIRYSDLEIAAKALGCNLKAPFLELSLFPPTRAESY